MERLGLTPYWGQSKAIPNKGGTEYRWFWLGLCYLRDHSGIHESDGPGNLFDVFTATLRLVIEMVGEPLHQTMPQKYLPQLVTYLSNVVELPKLVRQGGTLPDFAAEMERYASAKKKSGKELLCTLCNSAYPTDEQSDNAVLFQPWVYKNKLALYAGKNAGGVCSICSLELMLRQNLQRGMLRLTGAKFEGLRPKYLAIYPNFFFTAETGGLVQGILNQLQDINFFTVRRELDGRDLTIDTLLQLDAFLSPDNGAVQLQRLRPALSSDDDESEAVDGEDERHEPEAQAGEKPQIACISSTSRRTIPACASSV